MLSSRDLHDLAELSWLANKATETTGLGGWYDSAVDVGKSLLTDTAKKAGAAGADLLASEIRGAGPGAPTGGVKLPPPPQDAKIFGLSPAVAIGGAAVLGLGAVFLLMRRKKGK